MLVEVAEPAAWLVSDQIGINLNSVGFLAEEKGRQCEPFTHKRWYGIMFISGSVCERKYDGLTL